MAMMCDDTTALGKAALEIALDNSWLAAAALLLEARVRDRVGVQIEIRTKIALCLSHPRHVPGANSARICMAGGCFDRAVQGRGE